MDSQIELLYARFLLSDGVSIDTRTIESGNLFIAVSGPNFDANKFAKAALEKGASYAIIDDPAYAESDQYVVVDDGLQALQDLAKFHRSKIRKPIIGITGSNGKTTTKELVTKVLEQQFVVYATKGNYNNHIGVPLTILHIHPQVEVAVVEMGANHVGEIAALCEIAKPTHGLITNIGKAHTETFGGIAGIIRGKSELFDFLRKSEGQVFINQLDSVLSSMIKRFSEPTIYPANDVRLTAGFPYLTLNIEGIECQTQLIGKYNYPNIAAAVALGKALGVSAEKICKGLESYQPDNARSQVIKRKDATIILDAYNANPDSMKVALENLSEYRGKRVAILGDMNELENSDEEHRAILDLAMQLGIEEVLTVGSKIGSVTKLEKHFPTKDELIDFLAGRDFAGNIILLKASRSIQLETVLNYIAI